MSNWPKYFSKKLWVGNPKSNIGILTLWTPKERILSKLDPQDFAIGGQLYSKAGISFLIRNIFANPQIRYLVLCGEDRTGAGEALLALMKTGSGPEIDENIPSEDLRLFRNSVQVLDLRGEVDSRVIKKAISALEDKPAFGEPKVFPEPSVATGEFPSEASFFEIREEKIATAWPKILKNVLRFGQESETVYGATQDVSRKKEIHNLAVIISGEDTDNPCLPEYLGITKADLEKYYQNFFVGDRGQEPYTYGERLFAWRGLDQVSEMVKKLKSFPQDVGAVAVLWQPKIDNFPIRKPWRTPCLTLIQAECYEQSLNLTAYFRSNDMFGAWPQNAFALRRLQEKIALEIGKKVGCLMTISHAAHIYEHAWGLAQKIIDQHCVGAGVRGWDPRGNLIIGVFGEDIVVTHISPQGKILGKYHQNGCQAKAAEKLMAQLFGNLVISRIDHALDVGGQLARAEDAIKLGLNFEQDVSLKKAGGVVNGSGLC